MGAAASLSAAGLPERMNRADVQQLCDHRYTEAQFVAICDSEGFITPQQFVEQVVLEQEEECRRLFVSFCRHDAKGRNSEEMDEEHLISFLRHCKLLSKNQFSIHDARTLFHKMIEEKVVARDEAHVHVVTEMDAEGAVQQRVYISYQMFREQLLPVLAEKKSLPMDRVMFLLSRCEANTRLIRGEWRGQECQGRGENKRREEKRKRMCGVVWCVGLLLMRMMMMMRRRMTLLLFLLLSICLSVIADHLSLASPIHVYSCPQVVVSLSCLPASAVSATALFLTSLTLRNSLLCFALHRGACSD